MSQPKNNLSFIDDRQPDAHDPTACGVVVNGDETQFVWVSCGATPLSACRAGVKRLRRLIREAETELAKLEKGGA